MLEQNYPLLFTGWSSTQFFNAPPFPKYSQLGHTLGTLHLTMQSLCDLWDAMTRQWLPNPS